MTATANPGPKASFTSTVALEEEGPFPTFSEALKNFMTRIKDGVDNRRFGFQILETACWIQRNSPYGSQVPISFYDARDLGYHVGLLRQAGDGFEFDEAGKEPDAALVEAICEQTMHFGNAFDFMDRLMEKNKAAASA